MTENDSLRNKRLTADRLIQVSGGFHQTDENCFSYGEDIVCPNCGNEAWDQFVMDSTSLAEVEKDLYTCSVCGQQFAAAKGYGITNIL